MGNLDSLPTEITLDILRRLHIDSVIQYRLVSRSWNYPVYHCLLDDLKETEIKLESREKQLKSCPLPDKKPTYFKIHEIIKLVKKGIVNAQKNSGGPELGKLLHLKKITDKKVQLYLTWLKGKKRIHQKMKALQLAKQRRRYRLKVW
ncbi:hypothetical protein C5167_008192 [Papaver somniferum]|uniref:F-box domain-containing protein n=1 Tax=Papaver somniferum TaxID=3469 RepID=A0A4Y7JTU5_PAPSO|nr:hypothetical protein C5167_008192 [Papaver somniferum]